MRSEEESNMAKDRNLDRDRLDFGNGKIGALFRALFFPALIGMIFNSVLTLVDGMFVGHSAGAKSNAMSYLVLLVPGMLFLPVGRIGIMLYVLTALRNMPCEYYTGLYNDIPDGNGCKRCGPCRFH